MDRYFIRDLMMFITYWSAFMMGAQIERYMVKHGPLISMPIMDEPPCDLDGRDRVIADVIRDREVCPPVRLETVLVMQEISYLTVGDNPFSTQMSPVLIKEGSVLKPMRSCVQPDGSRFIYVNIISQREGKGRVKGWIRERDKKGNILLCYPSSTVPSANSTTSRACSAPR